MDNFKPVSHFQGVELQFKIGWSCCCTSHACTHKVEEMVSAQLSGPYRVQINNWREGAVVSRFRHFD